MIGRETEMVAHAAGGRYAPAFESTGPGVASAGALLPSLLARLRATLAGWGGSLSLLLPGTGQLFQGRVTHGLFYFSTTLFLAALAWAIVITASRLAANLPLLGLPPATMFAVLGGIWVLAAATHVAAVVSATRTEAAAPPVVSALASLLVPGWGQVLNGNRVRAGFFLAGAWLVAGVWIASSEPATRLLDTYLPLVTEAEAFLREPVFLWSARWTAPVLVWCLAIYDGGASASARAAATRAEKVGRAQPRLRAAR